MRPKLYIDNTIRLVTDPSRSSFFLTKKKEYRGIIRDSSCHREYLRQFNLCPVLSIPSEIVSLVSEPHSWAQECWMIKRDRNGNWKRKIGAGQDL